MKISLEDLIALGFNLPSVIASGVATLIFVFISFMIGIKILSKYRAQKNKVFITVGLTWIFISSPWWSPAFSFLTIVLFEYAFEHWLYLFLMNGLIPFALIFWIYSFCKLVVPKLINKIFIPYLLISIIYEIMFLVFLFWMPNLIASYDSETVFNYKRTTLTLIFPIFVIITALITGIFFSRESIKSSDKLVQWKGRFFLIGIISFTAAVLLDVITPENIFLRVIIRMILISSSVEYYFGFFLPKKIANLIIT